MLWHLSATGLKGVALGYFHLEPQDTILFVSGVFADNISWDEVMLDGGLH